MCAGKIIDPLARMIVREVANKKKLPVPKGAEEAEVPILSGKSPHQKWVINVCGQGYSVSLV
jgi:hypothetical protein